MSRPDALKLMQEFGFPFGDPKPKRVGLQHSSREFSRHNWLALQEKAPRDPYAKFKNKGKGKKKR